MRKPIIGVNLDFEEKGGHYSRFPWHALRTHYFDVLSELGATPIGLPSTNMDIDSVLAIVDGLLMTGGNDYDPSLYGEKNTTPDHSKIMTQRSLFDIKIVKSAIIKDTPVLGICGGMQAINIAFGGAIVQHIPHTVETDINHESRDATQVAHTVSVEFDTLLHTIVQKETFEVNSFHHQALKTLGKGLRVNARAEDGIIEGIESTQHRFCMGVQWHPEYLVTISDKKIFEAFVKAASH